MFQRTIRRTALACLLLGATYTPTTSFGSIVTWTGAGGPPDWNIPGNWVGGTGVPTLTDDVNIVGPGNPIFLFNGTEAANSLSFLTNGFTLIGFQITLGAGPVATINVDDSSPTEINATLETLINSSASSIFKIGLDRLTLQGASSFNSQFQVSMGYLNIQNNSGLGSTLGGTLVSPGATLEMQANVSILNEALSLDGFGVGGAGALRNVADTNNFDGNITLMGPSRINSDLGTLTLNPSFGNAITSASFDLTFGGNSDIVVSKPIDLGNGNLTKDGFGRTTLAAANSYSGTTFVSQGALRVQNGNALGDMLGGTQVSPGSSLELEGDITITNENISLSGNGVVFAGALRNISGKNTVAGNITLTTPTTIASDADKLILNPAFGNAITGAHTTVIFSGAGEVIVEKPIDLGTGGISKGDTGRTTLGAANNFDGGVFITGGTLAIKDSNGLGSTVGGTTVFPNSTLELQGGINIFNETISVDGMGDSNTGAIRSAFGNNQIDSTINLGGISVINSDADTLTLNTLGTAVSGVDFDLTLGGAGNILVPGAINLGNASLIKDGAGRVTLSAANTVNGSIFVTAGSLNVQNSSALGNNVFGTFVANGAALELQGGVTITDETLSLDGFGPTGEGSLRNISGDNQFNSTMVLNGSVLITSDSGKLTINPSAGDALIAGSPVDLVIGGNGDVSIEKPINVDGSALTKVGPGKLTLSATSPYTGPTFVGGGTMIVTGDISASTLTTVFAGATLSGTGDVGDLSVNSDGILAPGLSPGILDVLDTFFDDAIFNVEIFGATLGTQYDQLNVTGGITILTDTQLNIDLGVFNPLDDGSQTFTIVNNDLGDALTLTGHFTSGMTILTEGTFFTTGGQSFTISYVGGDGNDVVLTAVPEPGTSTLLLSSLAAALGLRRRRNGNV